MLRVGQDIRIAYRGQEMDKDYRVVEDSGDHYRCTTIGESWGDFILPKEHTDYSYRVVGVETQPAMPAAVVGSTCRRCKEYNNYAEPTRIENRSHICRSCSQDGYGTTWGDK